MMWRIASEVCAPVPNRLREYLSKSASSSTLDSRNSEPAKTIPKCGYLAKKPVEVHVVPLRSH